MIKKHSSTAAQKKKSADSKDINSLAKKLSDRVYGEDKDSLIRTTVSINSSMLIKLEDLAKLNKRSKNDLRSVSSIVRQALDEYCSKYDL